MKIWVVNTYNKQFKSSLLSVVAIGINIVLKIF